MAASVGTLAWSQRSGGVIGVGDKMVLVLQGLQTAFGSLVSRVSRALTIGPRFPQLPVDPQAFIESKIPDLDRPGIARGALEACEKAGRGNRWLLGHCYRTFGFAVMWAAKYDLEVDYEMLWVASMLHDIALSGECSEGPADAPCFAVRGGAEAHRLAEAHDWDESRSKALYEAISMHLNARIDRTKRPEAFAMASGTALDVAGVGFSRLPVEAISAVLDPVWHPRTRSSQNDGARYDGIRGDMWKLWSAEAGCHQHCRGQFLNAPFGFRWLGLKRRIDSNPLSDRQGFALGDAR